jgi:septum formation protein
MRNEAIRQQFKNHDIILASGSPRRKELLQQAGIPFRVMVRPVSERYPEDMQPIEVVHFLCRQKAGMFDDELQNERTIVVTADTIVVSNNMILNKSAHAAEAHAMLRELSGKSHEVHTGVCIRQADKSIVFHETTRVFFRTLSDLDITHYIDAYQPFDKAGSYGIQEWIGLTGISRIEGSYSNVVGLPVHRVYEELLNICR